MKENTQMRARHQKIMLKTHDEMLVIIWYNNNKTSYKSM